MSHIILIGARQTGKSTFLKGLAAEVNGQFISLERHAENKGLSQEELVRRLVKDITSALPEEKGITYEGTDLYEYLRITRPDYLFIDEFADILQHYPNILHQLRAACEERFIGQMVLADRVHPDMFMGVDVSPFNIAQTVILPDLERDETTELIRTGFERNDIRISDEAVECVATHTNGHRYLTMRIGHMLAQYAITNEVTEINNTHVLGAIDSFVRTTDEIHWITLKKHFELLSGLEQRIIRGLVKGFSNEWIELMKDTPITTEARAQMVLAGQKSKLIAYGFVREQIDNFGNSDGTFTIRNPIYAQWFEKRMEELQ